MAHYMQDEWETHQDRYETPKPAINVKVYHYPSFLEGMEEDTAQMEWDAYLEDWWVQACELSWEYGYTGVFSEGRCGGWLVPYYQGNAKWLTWKGQGGNMGYPYYPDMKDFGERAKFLAFQRRIKAMMPK